MMPYLITSCTSSPTLLACFVSNFACALTMSLVLQYTIIIAAEERFEERRKEVEEGLIVLRGNFHTMLGVTLFRDIRS